MKLLLFSLILAIPGILNAAIPERYSVSISGPVADVEFSCNDPCQLDQQEIVGTGGGKLNRSKATRETNTKEIITGSRIKRTRNTNPGEDGIQCLGKCSTGNKSVHLSLSALRTLREGIKMTITDGNARFIFYSVVNTEKGPVTRVQQSSFRVDRPLIQLNLHGHEVEILTAMEGSKKANWLSNRNP